MARRRALTFSRDAYDDLDAIFLHIAEDDPGAARRQLKRILEHADKLRDFPEMGRSRSRLAPTLRSIVEGSYVIFYYPRDARIEVARILHGHQDIEDQLASFLRRTFDPGGER